MQIMIDIETLSTEPTAAITSIGAVAFGFNKGIADEFYRTIDLSDTCKKGHICGYTLQYWLKQSDASRQQLLNGCLLNEALTDLLIWMDLIAGRNPCIWANSPAFDLVILKSAINNPQVLPQPYNSWKYWNERDYRTLIKTAEYLGFRCSYKPKDATHNALDDARNQAEELIKAHNFLWELKSKSDDRDLIYLAADLKCSNCATQLFDEPWHHSNSSNKHIHLCDTCNQQLIENKINLEKLGV